MLYLGTSGFSYEDWVGRFYPRGLPRREWLSFYAREFNCVEINSTFYAVPRPATITSMARRTGPEFLFAVKAPQGLTHSREDDTPLSLAFCQAVAPLVEVGKLGCVLAQFPYSFAHTQKNRDYIQGLKEKLEGLPLVVEFRHRSWVGEGVFSWLRGLGVGFCCVDEPALPQLLPPLAVATTPIGYIRFHGRNMAKWWQHRYAYERYDYTYSDEELREWVPRIQALSQACRYTFIFANNHFLTQSVNTLRQLKRLLGVDSENEGLLPFRFGGAGLRPAN